ncbi:pyridoxamine 5'-phosphate oxidase family protein [Mycolicibacterium chlorophenolicum]|uniref:Putative pyridoxine/pyridoxamine 5'-phosphate oxidase n=1 Tax=Mycolicibacterium chlorophenolicum TaxID=37916 RepID=A0A0J6WNS6_9MYCO|nr:pyridoxamine 5'-phosphate oxidase family protein [Mycolicibacterium chlorophenolicum]KMO83758.1 putative pyridoxine/pyridoxamine 5'-phosphate oxidase [Mycolicibacterium chlorophenolicum]
MNAAERREFVRSHRAAIFGYSRKKDGPSLTVVYYVMDGDDILVSSTTPRSKTRAVVRNPKISLCVLDESWPFAYLTVYCDATVDATVESDLDAVVSLYKRIFGTILGREFDDSAAHDDVVEKAIKEERVVLRLKPYATFMTPPRPITSEADIAPLVHLESTTMPW